MKRQLYILLTLLFTVFNITAQVDCHPLTLSKLVKDKHNHYVLRVLNTIPDNFYALQFSTNLQSDFTNISTFYGSKNGRDIVITNKVINSPYGFWRVEQEGVLIHARAGNGFNYPSPCSGNSKGFLSFYNSPSTNWGFSLIGTNHFAMDINRSNTCIQYEGQNGDFESDINKVKLINPLSTQYRFIAYFPNNYPTNKEYSILLMGFSK